MKNVDDRVWVHRFVAAVSTRLHMCFAAVIARLHMYSGIYVARLHLRGFIYVARLHRVSFTVCHGDKYGLIRTLETNILEVKN
jgi:hypothetical protein